MAEGHVEVPPGRRDRGRRLEDQWAVPRELPGVFDRAAGGVVSESLRYSRAVREQPQEAATVAADVEDPKAREIHVDGLEHGPPDEGVLVLHSFVFGGTAPVVALHGGHANGGPPGTGKHFARPWTSPSSARRGALRLSPSAGSIREVESMPVDHAG